MTVPAGAGDTWEIPGPTFLQIYLVLAAAARLSRSTVDDCVHRVRRGPPAGRLAARRLGPGPYAGRARRA